MLALVGQPSLRGCDACMVLKVRGASWRNCRQILHKTSFSPLLFLLSRISVFFWSGVVLWLLWIGRARHPGPGSAPFLVEVLNVGGWLTHCDFALDVGVDFLAVVEHRLIPARVRGEWARLRCKKMASIWAPASQEASHVGHVWVGVVSFRGAPLSLPSIAAAQFQRLFDCGRAVRCVLPLGGGRVMHLVVLYGYQGADRDRERLALLVGDFVLLVSSLVCWLVTSTWRPPKSLAWQKGFRLVSGLMWRHLGLWLLVGILGLPASSIWDLP